MARVARRMVDIPTARSGGGEPRLNVLTFVARLTAGRSNSKAPSDFGSSVMVSPRFLLAPVGGWRQCWRQQEILMPTRTAGSAQWS
jgi:hypothetical protein